MSTIAPFAGFGVGMRKPHYQHFLTEQPQVDFVEVISENYMIAGGKPLRILEQVRARMPVILHGVSMSIGSAHGLDRAYLAQLRALADRIEPLWVSDHLCWTRTSAHNSHDLLPMPYTQEALALVCDNIAKAQDALGRPLLFENPSSYLAFPQDEMREWEFLSEMVQRTGSYLLLDINNIFVSAHNHRFDAREYLAGLPLDRVRQIHLAGHKDGEIKIDTHDQPVCDGVWALYREAMAMLGPVATMIERDGNIPQIGELLEEVEMARQIVQGEQAKVPV